MFDWLGENAWAAWLSASILLAVAEMASMDLFLIMLASGAFFGMLAAVIGLPVVAQVIIASATAVAALAFVRPAMAKKLHGGPDLALGHGKLVGQQAVCTERITAHDAGRIKLAGEIWTAQPYDESVVIEPGQTVDVLEIRGATAIVHPLPQIEP